MDEQRFALAARGDPTAEPGLVRDVAGNVFLVLPDGSRVPLSNGGSQPLVFTFSAAEVAARFDGGAFEAAMELAGYDDSVLGVFYEVEANTLDQNPVLADLYAYTPSANTSDVLNNGDNNLCRLAIVTPATYSAAVAGAVVSGSDLVPHRLQAGRAAYLAIQLDAAPTTGSISIQVWRLA